MSLNNKYKKILLTDNNGKDVIGSMAINEDVTSSIIAFNQKDGVLVMETAPGGVICNEIKGNGNIKRNPTIERSFIDMVEPYKEEIVRSIAQEVGGGTKSVKSFGLHNINLTTLMRKMFKANPQWKNASLLSQGISPSKSTTQSSGGITTTQFSVWSVLGKLGRKAGGVAKKAWGCKPVKVAAATATLGAGAAVAGAGVGKGIDSVGEGLESVGEGAKSVFSTEIGMGIDIGDALLLAGGIFGAKMIFDAYDNYRKEKEEEEKERKREEKQEERDQKFEDMMMMQMQMNNNANK